MKNSFAQRVQTPLAESVTEKIKRLEAENRELKSTVSIIGKRTESEIITEPSTESSSLD